VAINLSEKVPQAFEKAASPEMEKRPGMLEHGEEGGDGGVEEERQV